MSDISWPIIYRSMDKTTAHAFINWQYESHYHFYNLSTSSVDASFFPDPINGYFAAFDANGEFVAHRCFGAVLSF